MHRKLMYNQLSASMSNLCWSTGSFVLPLTLLIMFIGVEGLLEAPPMVALPDRAAAGTLKSVLTELVLIRRGSLRRDLSCGVSV